MTEQIKGLAANPSDLSLSLRRKESQLLQVVLLPPHNSMSTPTIWDRVECIADARMGGYADYQKDAFIIFI